MQIFTLPPFLLQIFTINPLLASSTHTRTLSVTAEARSERKLLNIISFCSYHVIDEATGGNNQPMVDSHLHMLGKHNIVWCNSKLLLRLAHPLSIATLRWTRHYSLCVRTSPAIPSSPTLAHLSCRYRTTKGMLQQYDLCRSQKDWAVRNF